MWEHHGSENKYIILGKDSTSKRKILGLRIWQSNSFSLLSSSCGCKRFVACVAQRAGKVNLQERNFASLSFEIDVCKGNVLGVKVEAWGKESRRLWIKRFSFKFAPFLFGRTFMWTRDKFLQGPKKPVYILIFARLFLESLFSSRN